jgi:hypothetical protein
MHETLATEEVARIAGLSKQRVAWLVTKRIIIPAVRGRRGRSFTARFTTMQALGAAVAGAFRRAGCDPHWAGEAGRFVSRMQPGELWKALIEGRTLVAVAPPQLRAATRLVKPDLPPTASRADRLMLAQLSLKTIYKAVVYKIAEVTGKPVLAATAELLRAVARTPEGEEIRNI